MDFDYAKLKYYLIDKFYALKITIFYYTAYPPEGTREYSLEGKHKFYVFLKKALKFNVIKKPLKRIVILNEYGKRSVIEKGNMDVEITIDAVRDIKEYDIAVFFTGDSDFLPLVSFIRNMGKKVYIFSSDSNISSELRTGSDSYFNLLLLKEDVWRKNLKFRRQK